MGADFLLYSLPWVQLDDARQKLLHDAIDELSEEHLQDVADGIGVFDDDEIPMVRHRLHKAVNEYMSLANRRDTAIWKYGTDMITRIYTGGLSWGDGPTDCCETFDLIATCEPIHELVQRWALNDAQGNKSDHRETVSKYQPDIAGIMTCLCDALTNEAHGVKGCVIESSDNDNDDGEIFIETPAGESGLAAYCIKVAPAR